MKSFPNYILILIIVSVSITLHAQDTQKDIVYGITRERANALAGVALGIFSLIFTWLAYGKTKRNKGNKTRQTKGIIALLFGITGILFSFIHLSKNTGDFGTGGGRAGAMVGLGLNFFGVCLSSLTLLSRIPGKEPIDKH